MKFKFDDYAKYIQEKFSSDFTLEEVKEILYLEEDGYNKSIPDSHQKRLLLDRIVLEGEKTAGESFIYDRPLHSGVSMWVADNLKGKSTIFKAIGFALTGRDKFTPLVKTWLNRITLQFTIHQAKYTIVLNLAGAQLKAFVYGCTITDLNEDTEALASFKSRDSYAAYMQELFFEEFGYYPIKRVQATQASVNFSDADLSWTTYYSSIYHQSKDYGNLEIGNQHGMVFQMLLGLEYTYSIHALDVKAKKAERDWNLITEDGRQEKSLVEDVQKLKTELEDVKAEIEALSNNTDKRAVANLEQNLGTLISERESARKDKLDGDTKLYKLRSFAAELEVQLNEKQEGMRQAGKEINKQKKHILEYQEYIDSGIFFNNLVVTECPHCDHEVDKAKLKVEKEFKICMLCDHQMQDEDGDVVIWKERISEAEGEIRRNQELIEKQNGLLEGIKTKSHIYRGDISRLQSENELLEKKILAIDEQIGPLELNLSVLLKSINQDYFPKLENLFQRKVNVESQIALAEKKNGNLLNDVKLKKRAEVLKMGYELMLNRRRKAGTKILEQLEAIMLTQLHALGLPSYTEVRINPDNFVIHYYQGKVISSFSDISEGEQLRAKLALYLSLIELDLSQGLGRHPRLIILDSPTKEEGDLQFVEGLKNALIHIEQNFADKVQVIVGTANRNLRSVISKPEKLEYREKDEFVF